jgi:hypothetical protein
MGLGFERAGLAASTKQAHEEGETDAEPAGDQPERTVAAIDGGGDALSEVHGRGFHPAPPLNSFPSFYCVGHPTGNRARVRLVVTPRSIIQLCS